MRLRIRQARKNLWANLPGRIHGLTGNLTAQLAADLYADRTERLATLGGRYIPIRRAR